MQFENGPAMPDMVGKTIGQYQLIELIGKGDTSYVYKAFQPAMSRYVAIKVLFPSLAASPDYMEQFQRRLARIASLQHSDILPVYDYGQEEGVLYLVTRYIEEGALEDYLPDYYAPRAALGIIQSLASALDYAHARGLVHANLKPENVLIDAEHQPLLADFAALQGEPLMLALTSPYNSPEEAQGALVDKRSDVYGLGALLYTLLIGEPPPADRVPTPRVYRPDLSPALEKVILKAMASVPEQRFQSAGELSRALQRALDQAVAPAPEREPAVSAAEPEPVYVPAPQQTADSRSLNGLVYIFGALALVAVLVAVYFIFFAGDDETTAPPTAVPGVPMVTANTDVNVRTGPDTAYEVIGAMRSGQSAEAIGMSPNGGWWVIKFPAAAGGSGWVSGQFTTATDTDSLPIVQPPPPPTGEAAPTEPPAPTGTPPVAATEPLPPTDEAPAPTDEPPAPTDEPPVEGTEPAPTEEPPTEGGPGPGICNAPALLLAFGLMLTVPLQRRRRRTR
jgi:hypothetical protein